MKQGRRRVVIVVAALVLALGCALGDAVAGGAGAADQPKGGGAKARWQPPQFRLNGQDGASTQAPPGASPAIAVARR